jgi:hypothetical protein
MGLIVETMARAVERSPLPQQLVEWLNSDLGRNAVTNAVEKSQSEVKNLNNARKVQQEQLNVPITL